MTEHKWFPVKRKALNWWNRLTNSQQRDIEHKIYGYGDDFEDNTLTNEDIIHMYKKSIVKL